MSIIINRSICKRMFEKYIYNSFIRNIKVIRDTSDERITVKELGFPASDKKNRTLSSRRLNTRVIHTRTDLAFMCPPKRDDISTGLFVGSGCIL